jgi:hypothetical protein
LFCQPLFRIFFEPIPTISGRNCQAILKINSKNLWLPIAQIFAWLLECRQDNAHYFGVFRG